MAGVEKFFKLNLNYDRSLRLSFKPYDFMILLYPSPSVTIRIVVSYYAIVLAFDRNKKKKKRKGND